MAALTILDERVSGKRSEIPQHRRVELVTVKSVLNKRTSPSTAYFVSGDLTSREALQRMFEYDIRALLVLDSGRVSGIFTEHDYLHHATRVASLGINTPVREVMASCAIFARPTDSAQSCLELMSKNRLRHLPIHDDTGPIAIVALDELHKEMVAYLERVCHETEVDHQVLFLRGTYSC